MYSTMFVRMCREATGLAMIDRAMAMTTMMIHGCATTRRDRRLKKPWSDEESPMARITRLMPGTRLSGLGRTRWDPRSVMIEGTSVTVPSTASSATMAAPAAIVLNIGVRRTSRPAIEQAMVSAENETVRPAVATVRTTQRRTRSFIASPTGGSPPPSPDSASSFASSSR